MDHYKFNGIGELYATFALDEDFAIGSVCKLTQNNTIGKAAAGESFMGVLADKRGAAAGVVLGGYVELPYSGTAPVIGYGKLTADGTGGVKTATSGREYLIVAVDKTAQTVGLFL